MKKGFGPFARVAVALRRYVAFVQEARDADEEFIETLAGYCDPIGIDTIVELKPLSDILEDRAVQPQLRPDVKELRAKCHQLNKSLCHHFNSLMIALEEDVYRNGDVIRDIVCDIKRYERRMSVSHPPTDNEIWKLLKAAAEIRERLRWAAYDTARRKQLRLLKK